jgi:glutamine---fructose-6-phosphate transaminase (isomerizing)
MSKGRKLTSQMRHEAVAAADAILAQAADPVYARIAQRFYAQPPHMLLTLARGSSDHAAHYFGYLSMLALGLPVTSLPPSVISLHQSPLKVAGQWAVTLSQSGQSRDLIDGLTGLRRLGATTLAVVNVLNSPLSLAADLHVNLLAGEERSIAATKSYLAMLGAAARLVGHIADDQTLLKALERLPEALAQACQVDWQVLLGQCAHASKLLVIGRGLSQSIAKEAALKLKETCAIQAEAFSSAEVRHGPMALIRDGYLVLVFAPRGPEQNGLIELSDDLRRLGANVLLIAPDGIPTRTVTLVETGHPWLDPLCLIQSFYLLVENLARLRGYNPDAPRHLSKVTSTV